MLKKYHDFRMRYLKNEFVKKNNLSSICPIVFSPSYKQMPLSELADLILKNSLNVRLQTQLHKTIWGEVNGK